MPDKPTLTLSATITIDLDAVARQHPNDPAAVKAAIDAQLANTRRTLLALAGIHNEETR